LNPGPGSCGAGHRGLSLRAFPLSHHPRPPVETCHPHAGRYGAFGLIPPPRPDDGLIHRYASAPQIPGKLLRATPAPCPLQRSSPLRLPHLARRGLRHIVRGNVTAPMTLPESLGPGALITPDGGEREWLDWSRTTEQQKKRGAFGKTPRSSPTEEIKKITCFRTPPHLARLRVHTPEPSTTPPKTRRCLRYYVDKVLLASEHPDFRPGRGDTPIHRPAEPPPRPCAYHPARSGRRQRAPGSVCYCSDNPDTFP